MFDEVEEKDEGKGDARGVEGGCAFCSSLNLCRQMI